MSTKTLSERLGGYDAISAVTNNGRRLAYQLY